VLQVQKAELLKENYKNTAKEFYTRLLSKYKKLLVIKITNLA